MRQTILIIATAMALMVSGCANLPPAPKGDIGNIFRIFYHECPKCGSLDGGYYGKNSVSSWRSETGTACRHSWTVISKDTFDAHWKQKAGNTNHY